MYFGKVIFCVWIRWYRLLCRVLVMVWVEGWLMVWLIVLINV